MPKSELDALSQYAKEAGHTVLQQPEPERLLTEEEIFKIGFETSYDRGFFWFQVGVKIAKAQLAKGDKFWRQILRDTIIMKDAECQAKIEEIEENLVESDSENMWYLNKRFWRALRKEVAK